MTRAAGKRRARFRCARRSRWLVGEVDGVPLTFSDLAPAPDGRRLFFCAVAEATVSTYDDGPCVAGGVDLLDPTSRVIERFERLPVPHKVEGISPLDTSPERHEVLLVADEDMPECPAPLLRAVF